KEPTLEGRVSADLETEIRAGHLDIGIRLSAPGFWPSVETGLDPLLANWSAARDLATNWEILYREDLPQSKEALALVQRLCAAAKADFLSRRLALMNVTQRAVPVQTEAVAVKDPQEKQALTLAALIPLVLILMTITGAVYPAIDLTAGERERGTLEILVA